MEEVDKKKHGTAWFIGTWALVLGFVVFMVVLAIVAARQDFQMVEEDYYARELEYQTRIDKLNLTDSLGLSPRVSVTGDGDLLEILFPVDSTVTAVTGTVLFYRPSSSERDRTQPLTTDRDGRQTIDVSDLISGLWRVKIDFSVNNHDLYHEDQFILAR